MIELGIRKIKTSSKASPMRFGKIKSTAESVAKLFCQMEQNKQKWRKTEKQRIRD